MMSAHTWLINTMPVVDRPTKCIRRYCFANTEKDWWGVIVLWRIRRGILFLRRWSRRLAMGVLGILGVVVVWGMRDLRVRIAVVALAKLSAAVIITTALGRRRAFFPVDVLAGAFIATRAIIVIGDMGTATCAAGGLPAVSSPPFGGIATLAATARLHGLPRIYWLVRKVVLDGWAHLGPVFRGPVLA
ncbi:hypothetical protein BDW71DRAFT_103827 [Aspergillus fruticulosus]